MSRQNLIALAGSVAFILLAFWGVTLLFPGPAEPIIGTWRIDRSPGCDDGAIYFIVTQSEIDLAEHSKPPKRIIDISGFETKGDTHRLRVHFGNRAPDLDLFAPYEIVGDTLTFHDVDWTPEARAKYPTEVQAAEAVTGTGRLSIGNVLLTAFQPYHRCPG